METGQLPNRWDALHADKRFCPIYPHDRVVAWVFRNFPRSEAQRFSLLDLGAGAGRHSIFMASHGYAVSACDFSATGLAEARSRAEQASLEIETQVCEADDLSRYPDECFDGVVCYGVLYYLPYERYCKAAREIHRVLKPGGKALIVIRSDADSRCDKSRMTGHCTYTVPTLGEGAPSNVEAGMVMTFLGRDDIDEVFGHFRERVVDRVTVTSANGAFIDDDWHVSVVK